MASLTIEAPAADFQRKEPSAHIKAMVRKRLGFDPYRDEPLTPSEYLALLKEGVKIAQELRQAVEGLFVHAKRKDCIERVLERSRIEWTPESNPAAIPLASHSLGDAGKLFSVQQ